MSQEGGLFLQPHPLEVRGMESFPAALSGRQGFGRL